MGTVNITWLKNQPNTGVAVGNKQNAVGVEPIDFTDASFDVVTSTSSTSKNSSAAPADTVLAMVHSVSGAHYVRNNKDSATPTTTTGGIPVLSGGVAFIPIAAGQTFSICTTS